MRRLLLLLGGCLLLGLSLWLGQQSRGKGLALAIALLSLTVLWHPSLHSSNTPGDSTGSGFEPSQIARLQNSGRAVFLDVTADWCITCKVNERLVLHTQAMQRRFEDQGVEYLVADWTRYDPAITDLLAQFQRNGIPLYVLYPADPAEPPQILPQILTADIVERALDSL